MVFTPMEWMLSSRREDEKKRGFRNSTLRRHWDKEESAKDTWEGAIANGGKGGIRIMCFIGEMIKFQKLLKIQQDKDKVDLGNWPDGAPQRPWQEEF